MKLRFRYLAILTTLYGTFAWSQTESKDLPKSMCTFNYTCPSVMGGDLSADPTLELSTARIDIVNQFLNSGGQVTIGACNYSISVSQPCSNILSEMSQEEKQCSKQLVRASTDLGLALNGIHQRPLSNGIGFDDDKSYFYISTRIPYPIGAKIMRSNCSIKGTSISCKYECDSDAQPEFSSEEKDLP